VAASAIDGCLRHGLDEFGDHSVGHKIAFDI
jgi:hypothetical protein